MAKNIGYGIGVVLGFLHLTGNAELANNVAVASGAMAGPIISELFDLIIHKIQHGSVATHSMLGAGCVERLNQALDAK